MSSIKKQLSFLLKAIRLTCSFNVSASVSGLLTVMLPQVIVMPDSYLLHCISPDEEMGLAASTGLIAPHPDKDKFNHPPVQPKPTLNTVMSVM